MRLMAAVALVTAGAACATQPKPVTSVVPAPAPAQVEMVAAPPCPVVRASGKDDARLRAIQVELGALRGRSFRCFVPAERQARAAFREYVRGELATELPAQKAADQGRAMVALGFAPEGFDLRAATEEALVTQVAAYYDTKARTFRVVESTRKKEGEEPGGDEIVIAHELTHALQDQQFDLELFNGERARELGRDDDEQLARRFVVEGEATFMMFAHALGRGAGADIHLGPFAVAGLRMMVAMASAADLVELMAMSHRGSGAKALDEDTRAEIEAVARLPLYLTLTMSEPYFKGAQLVSDVWAAGGWPAVDGLFRQPPQSTEQALHPREKLLGERDRPVRVRLPASPPPLPPARGAPRLLETDVLGELGWRIYFKTWKIDGGDEAARGWGGDRFWVWERGGRLVTLVATTWDDEREAEEFARAYELSLPSRFPKATLSTADGALMLRAPKGRTVIVQRRGRDVDVIDGADPEDLPSLRAALTAAERAPR
jgi:hypothetical protein